MSTTYDLSAGGLSAGPPLSIGCLFLRRTDRNGDVLFRDRPFRPRAQDKGVATIDSVEATRSATAGAATGRLDPNGEMWLTSVYETHCGGLLTYATRLCGDRHVAEDVVQETLIRAWRNRAELGDGGTNLRAWLYTVTRNVIYDRHRARRSRPSEAAPIDSEGGLHGANTDDPADGVVDAIAVHDAMDRLGDTHREVLLLVYFGDQTTAEAAELLGVPLGTVKSRVYYALRALRLTLDEGQVAT
jgi:RNA polymerase sigma-70 factor, ECF subfamily